MAEIKVYYDQVGRTLTVWFGDPSKEVIGEEIGDDTVVMKSEDGAVLGFEKLNVSFENAEKVSFEYARSPIDLANV
jgi:hypothetical protein